RASPGQTIVRRVSLMIIYSYDVSLSNSKRKIRSPVWAFSLMAKVTLPGGVKLCIGGKSTILTGVILGSKLFPFKMTSSAKRERFKNRKDTTNDSSFIIIGLNCILR